MAVAQRVVRYPTSDGKPMAETDLHFNLMMDTRVTVDDWFADDPNVYVSGNLLLYYVRGNKRRHVAPDVFVVKGVAKKLREYYLLWEEGKGPDAVIEITSSSTRKEDTNKKFVLYRDTLKVCEYFMFDPRGDYLKPSMQGYRLIKGDYVPIAPIADRMPSNVLGLHLERDGTNLRLFNPATDKWLLTRQEQVSKLEKSNQDLRAELEMLKRELGQH